MHMAFFLFSRNKFQKCISKKLMFLFPYTPVFLYGTCNLNFLGLVWVNWLKMFLKNWRFKPSRVSIDGFPDFSKNSSFQFFKSVFVNHPWNFPANLSLNKIKFFATIMRLYRVRLPLCLAVILVQSGAFTG